MSAINTVKKFFPQVTKVIDAKTNAAIEVTEKDAASTGKKKNKKCRKCNRKLTYGEMKVHGNICCNCEHPGVVGKAY